MDQFVSGPTGSGFEALNFFSFFTIQANRLAIVALVAAALGPGAPSRRRDLLRGAAVFALVLTGLVFAILLADVQEDLQLTKSWVDTVLHRVMPVVLTADWLLDPPGHRVPVRSALAWLAFPAAWTVYTLVRGAITGWYPYRSSTPGSTAPDGWPSTAPRSSSACWSSSGSSSPSATAAGPLGLTAPRDPALCGRFRAAPGARIVDIALEGA